MVAVVTLAMAIGANTALFSVVNAALFRPIHARNPAELVSLFNGGPDRQGTSNHSYPAYVELRDGTRDVLSGLAAYTTRPVNMVAGRQARRINVGLVSANYFSVLGVRPSAGRDFLVEEDVTPGGHAVALISESLWRREFGQAALPRRSAAVVDQPPNTPSWASCPTRPRAMALVVKVPITMQGPIRGGRDYLSRTRQCRVHAGLVACVPAARSAKRSRASTVPCSVSKRTIPRPGRPRMAGLAR